MDTGFPDSDAMDDFIRLRRRQAMSALLRRLRRQPSDTDVILPYQEVIAALGFAGERDLGLQVIPLDSIVGTVDRTRDFDRRFRPTSTRVRSRWERIARAQRRGVAMPPISAYRIGTLHFVRDGHHRVSVARALRWKTIEGHVTEVQTVIKPESDIRVRDLIVKGHERLFFERVPLPPEGRERIHFEEPWRYGDLAEAVEAWGFRAMQAQRRFLDRPTVAREWYRQDYRPVVDMLREHGLLGDENEAEAYMRISAERYRLLRTHEWNDEVIDQLLRERRRGPRSRLS